MYYFFGMQILIFILCIFIFKPKLGIFSPLSINVIFKKPKKKLGLILLTLIGIIIFLSLTRRILTPIFHLDVLRYHASRVLYWSQHKSLFFYPTNNDRQLIFPFGSELIFSWGVLFIKTEFIARLIYWLAFPLLAIGTFTILMVLGTSLIISLLGVAVVISMPVVFNYGITLKPLIWTILFSLGIGYWSIRIYDTSVRNRNVIFWFATYCVLAVNTKTVNLIAIPAGTVAILVIILFHKYYENKKFYFRKTLTEFVIYVTIILLISGLGLLFVSNLIYFNHPLGSDSRRSESIADFSFYQIYVHTVRFGAILLEIPTPWYDDKLIRHIGNKLIHFINADKPLPKELNWHMVGHYKYRYSVPNDFSSYARSFGIAGFLYILMIMSSIKIIKNKNSLKRISGYLIIFTFLLLTTLYIPRWMTNSGATRRFLTPIVVTSVPLILYMLHSIHNRRIFSIITFILIGFVFGFVCKEGFITWNVIKKTGFDYNKISHRPEQEMSPIFRKIPKNATVIVLITSYFSDYFLFGPDYTRRVIQVTHEIDEDELAYLEEKYPNAYICVNKIFAETLSVLNRSKKVVKVYSLPLDKLFKFKN